ncbi:MSMEG_1061 family FMN-dependent PPOX-type flavoprotein [Vandammella animalimorsus]|uniref:Phosphohydrolase n=1 Tax=Vandammella animalimorsus TaxID=2029117 RepID=A0A2A2A4U6_9BURK|nr:MSMEG_1061 family FMN-dependent PPOX-type flavoprotein [Vandammella animalimorsus]PAT33205.1 phosphohydrolase [Vandammella animalimorsus]
MIESLQALRQLYPQASARSRAKQLDHLDATMRRFIAHAPLCILASAGANGQGLLDASPRGGLPGFVQAPDARTLLIPDATGNNRLDTLENLLADPRLGLLFLLPGVDEVLRVNGTARLRDEAAFTQRFVAGGIRPPRLVIEMAVQEAYLHCPKALMRARLWRPEAQAAPGTFPSMNAMLRAQLGAQVVPETEEEARQRYRTQLREEGLDPHVNRP